MLFGQGALVRYIPPVSSVSVRETFFGFFEKIGAANAGTVARYRIATPNRDYNIIFMEYTDSINIYETDTLGD